MRINRSKYNLAEVPTVQSRTRNSSRPAGNKVIVVVGVLTTLAIGAGIAVPFAMGVFSSEQSTSDSTSTVTTTTPITATTTTATTATTTSVTTTTATTSTTSTTSTTATTATTTTTTPATSTSVSTTTTITAVLTAFGPQLNYNPSSLSNAWSLCYSATYSVPMFPNISTILGTCWKAKLLLGCRPVGNTLLTLAAMGNRADVLFDCSSSSTMTNVANGVGWYFAMNTAGANAWGFVSGSNSASRGNCDGDMSTNPAYRLCWHMIGTSGGWRCGATGSLDTSTSWEKVIYHAM